MIEITKPMGHLPVFMVVNYKHYITKPWREKMNLIVLNSRDVEEFKERLSKNLDHSRKFIYWLHLLNEYDVIVKMNELTLWMLENNFKFWVEPEKLEQYCNTLEEAQNKINMTIERG